MRKLAFILLTLLNPAHSWEHYGADLGGTRFVANSIVQADNLENLKLAWEFRTGDYTDGEKWDTRPSSFKATPVLSHGKLIFSTGFNRVLALDPSNGKLLWRYDPKVNFKTRYSETYTSRGISVWSSKEAKNDTCNKRVFLGTLDARLIAIDQKDGQPCREFGQGGEVDLSKGVKNYRHGQYSLTSPVTVINDVVVVGSSIGDNGATLLEPGYVRGFSVYTGEELWRWHPIAPNGLSETGAANVWSVMSGDAKRNLVFLPTTSPSPDFYGGKRIGDDNFANSLVALDATTGEIRWHFKTVHHDLWDYDNAAQPLLTDIVQKGDKIPVVVLATKMGFVFVLHRETGKPVFPIEHRPVPKSTVPGEVASPTQPFPIKPPPLHPVTSHSVKIWDYSKAHTKTCKDMLANVQYEGIFTPPNTTGTLLYPGNGGGTNWGSMAVNEQGVATLVVNRLPTVVSLVPRSDFNKRRKKEAGGAWDKQFTAQRGTPYGMARYDLYNRDTGLPCLEGPWSEIIGVDLNTGDIRWRTPLGVFSNAKSHPKASLWGGFNSGGPIMTSTGLIFVPARFGMTLDALDAASGQRLWQTQLPAQPHATPMSYILEDAQYIVIAVGGPSKKNPATDYVLAYKVSR